MKRLWKSLQFAIWPILCGLLLAISIVQYQQLQQPSSFSGAISMAASSVVSIHAARVDVESVERTADNRVNLYLEEHPSLGSGVIIRDDGYILTNLHVVDSLFHAFDTHVTLQDGRTVPATVVAWDEADDLAVLHINVDDLIAIEIGRDQNLKVGDVVFAIGYPRNIGQSVTQGIVSALNYHSNDSLSIIQTDAAIQPGNSGGALIDDRGRLVGINSSILSESGNFEGIGFATPASVAVAVMEDMVAQAVAANSGYLGVLTGEALSAQSSELFFGVDNIRGMIVENVDEGGAAMRAGIKPGDVITQVNEMPVTDGQNIMMEIRNKKPGDTVAIQVYRNGETLTLPTTLGFGQAVIIDP
ncbi:MAG: S1C family serine protease [Pseudohongiellaceae bacterium]